jgi:hypothetical protein
MFTKALSPDWRDLNGGSGAAEREDLLHLDVAGLAEFLEMAIEVPGG